MSFATSLSAFAAQAARERAAIFSGEVNAQGYNLQIGTTKFRAAFTTLSTAVDTLVHGRRLQCSAKILLPAAVEVTLDTGTLVTHLPTGDIYEVVEFRAHPGAEETSILLRRQEA